MTEMTQKMENGEKTVFANETTAAETPYVVMGELLLRAVERAGVTVTDDDRALVAETMRLLAGAIEAGSLCIAVPWETCAQFEKLRLAVSGDVCWAARGTDSAPRLAKKSEVPARIKKKRPLGRLAHSQG